MKKFLLRGIGGIFILAIIRASAAAIPPLNNAFVRYLGVADEIAPAISGTILALGYIFAVIGPLVAGRITDTKGPTRTFLTGGLVFAVFFMLWTYAPVYQILYLYRIILALASAAVFVGLQAFLLEGAPEGKKGMGMGFYGLGFGVGAAIGPMLAFIVVPRFGIVQAYYVLAIASLAATIIGFITVQIIKRFDKVDVVVKETEPEQRKESFWKIITSQPLIVYLIVLAAIFVGINNAAVFANVDDLGVSLGLEVGGGTAGVAIFALFSFAMPLGGGLGDRFGSAKTMLLGIVMLTIGFGGLAFIGNATLIYPLMAVAGIGGIFFTPNSMSLIGSYAPIHLKGTLLSYLQGAVGLGSAVGATVGGMLHSYINVQATFMAVFIAGFIASIVAVFVMNKHKKTATASS